METHTPKCTRPVLLFNGIEQCALKYRGTLVLKVVAVFESGAGRMRKSNTRDFVYSVALKMLVGLSLLVLYVLMKMLGVF